MLHRNLFKKIVRYLSYVCILIICCVLSVKVIYGQTLSSSLAFTLYLHGIGNGGDNANPNSIGNRNPATPTRNIQIELTDVNNIVTNYAGSVAYNAGGGNFTGTINVGALPTGVYTIRVKTDKYLRRSLPGIQSITVNQTKALPAVALIVGDSNGDNLLNILDYNMLLDCFSDFAPARNCTPAKKQMTDLNDDAAVNQFDINLLIRELSVQIGDGEVPMLTIMPQPTSGNAITPTIAVSGNVGKCGEPMDRWHPPVVTGPDGKPCMTGHEHGDAPPAWIAQAGYNPGFTGPFNTSAIENTVKHTSMKGFSAVFNGIEVYFRTHFASNPQERFGAYHSYEVFARDPSGGVSHWQGWNYSGMPTNANDRCLRRNPSLPCEATRPIVLVTDQTSLDQGIGCEQWYAFTSAWSWDFGVTICNTTTVYQPDKEQDAATAFNQATWKLTGDKGLTRRLEASWYGANSASGGNTPRGNPPIGVKFWATQFGQIVTSPNDPVCNGSTIGKDGNSYKNICLDQFIANTMRTVQFPGNAIQKTFDGTGVQIPN